MNVRVVVKRRDDGRQLLDERFSVDEKSPLTFGRSPTSNRLHIPDDQKTVSSLHGQIEVRDGGFWIVDVGSTNGTTLDGEALTAGESVRLNDGCRIDVGGFEMQFFTVAAQSGVDAGGDLSSTLVSFQAESGGGSAWDTLCADYARRRRLPPGRRREELRRELEAEVAGAAPAQQLKVLHDVRERAGGGAGDGAAPGAAEELLQAGLSALQRLGSELVAGQTLRTPRDVEQFTERVRAFFALSLDWLARSMEGRAEFERQFGAEVTLVFQRTKNQLKGQDAEALGRSLLDWTSGRDIGDVRDQLGNALRDLSQHQLGLLSGVKEAVAAVMERLSPQAIETLAMKDAGWLTSKGAKSWDVYQKIYGEFFEEKSKLFHEVISPAIRQGYLTSHETGPPAAPDPPQSEDRT